MNIAVSSVQTSLLFLLIVVFLRLGLRRVWASALVSIPLMSVLFLDQVGTTNTPLIFVFVLAAGAILTFATFRFGLLTLVTTMVASTLVINMPFRLDPSQWAARRRQWTIGLLIATACLAFYASRGGQPLFGAPAVEKR